MRGKFLFFSFGLVLGLTWPGFCYGEKIPRLASLARDDKKGNQITVSATVLEHITYFKNNGQIEVVTNSEYGAWVLEEKKEVFVIVRF